MTRKKLEEKTSGQSASLKFCDYSCAFAQSSSDVPSCMTENPIYCTKYNTEVGKSSVCMDVKNDRR